MKISNQNLDKILERCTKKEIDLIIYIGQFQDDLGVIKGVYYKDVLEAIDIAKSTFYKLLYGLEDKGIIDICWLNEDFSYWSVTVRGNVFDSSKQGGKSNDYSKGYFKLNYAILHTHNFKSMTKAEKVIVIRLLKMADFSYNQIRITTKTLMGWTGKSMRSVRKFVETLKKVFGITHPPRIDNGGRINPDHASINPNLLIISKTHGFETRLTSERDTRNRYLINFSLKRYKADAAEKDIKDCITVFKQFKINVADAMLVLLDKTIGQFGTLVPAYLNKMTQVFLVGGL